MEMEDKTSWVMNFVASGPSNNDTLENIFGVIFMMWKEWIYQVAPPFEKVFLHDETMDSFS